MKSIEIQSGAVQHGGHCLDVLRQFGEPDLQVLIGEPETADHVEQVVEQVVDVGTGRRLGGRAPCAVMSDWESAAAGAVILRVGMTASDQVMVLMPVVMDQPTAAGA